MDDATLSATATPVIFAADSLPKLWPASTPMGSYALARNADGKSPVQRLAEILSKLPHQDPPILFATQGSAESALQQMQDVYGDAGTLVIVEPDLGTGTLAILAATMLQQRGQTDRRLVFIPATLAAPHQDRLADALGALAAGDSARPHAACMLCAFASPASRLPFFHLFGSPSRTGWFPVRATLSSSPTADEHVFSSREYVVPIGAISVPASTLLDTSDHSAPMLSEAARNALRAGDTSGDTIMRPNVNFLWLAGQTELGALLARTADHVRVRMADPDMSVVTQWDDPNAKLPAPIVRPSRDDTTVFVAGKAQMRAIEGPGGTLLLDDSCAGAVKIPRRRRDEERQTGTDGMPDVIHEHVSSHPIVDIWRITLRPGARIPIECHFKRTETWMIAAGQAKVYLNGETYRVVAGDTVDIPAGWGHEISNDTDAETIVYELRQGAIRDRNDTLQVAQVADTQTADTQATEPQVADAQSADTQVADAQSAVSASPQSA